MKIEPTMNLDQLAERMGQNVTREEAAAMRDVLVASDYEDTRDIPETEWALMMANT